MITDENGNPIQRDEDAAPSNQNGKNHGSDQVDVRTVPSGTLQFNLMRVVVEEMLIEADLRKFEMIKQMQKMVSEPPEVEMMRARHHQLSQMHYLIANEINERMRDVDQARMKALGIESVELPEQGRLMVGKEPT